MLLRTMYNVCMYVCGYYNYPFCTSCRIVSCDYSTFLENLVTMLRCQQIDNLSLSICILSIYIHIIILSSKSQGNQYVYLQGNHHIVYNVIRIFVLVYRYSCCQYIVVVEKVVKSLVPTWPTHKTPEMLALDVIISQGLVRVQSN